jgi:quercetin dioxygenase-like cupin family protein
MTTPRPQARPTVLIDNDRAIATEWRFPPGGETGWHRHAHDYIVVPMTDGKLLLEEPGGATRTADLAVGKPYFRQEGVEHNVINANAEEFVFIEVELKRP